MKIAFIQWQLSHLDHIPGDYHDYALQEQSDPTLRAVQTIRIHLAWNVSTGVSCS